MADNGLGVNCPGANVIQGALIVGETENVGNPRYDFEEGRSRLIPDLCCLSQGVFGIQTYDGEGGVISNDITFYNFNDYQFLKNNVYRPTGAITGLDGPFTLVPSNKYFNLKFHNVQNNVYYQQSYTVPRQNLKGIALADSDGSITGTCGSVIIGVGDHVRLPDCQNKPTWNAYICPPNQIPLRNFEALDANTPPLTVTGTADYIHSVIGGKLIRLVDKASVLLEPVFVGNNYFGGNDTLYNATMDYMTNLRMYYDHLLLFSPDGSKTPSKLRIVMDYFQGGEWVRVAIPFPSGTTFTITANSSPVKLGASMNDLDMMTYFFDNTAQLLWIHVATSSNAFTWFHGKSSLCSHCQPEK